MDGNDSNVLKPKPRLMKKLKSDADMLEESVADLDLSTSKVRKKSVIDLKHEDSVESYPPENPSEKNIFNDYKK